MKNVSNNTAIKADNARARIVHRDKGLPFSWVVFLVVAVSFSRIPTLAQGHSGIPEIDSLPLHDWGRSSEPISYAKIMTLSAILPGAGQIYGQHPVRGGFLIGLETILGGLALYSTFVDIPRWRDEAGEALDSADFLFAEQSRNPDSAGSFETRRLKQVAFARERTQLASQQKDLVHSQMAWALGLHFYGILDAAEIAYLSQNKGTQTRSVRRAMGYGLAFPGGGQLYNRRYGKFGMLWMTLGASVVSAYSRQEMVNLLNHRLQIAKQESPNGSIAITELKKDRTLYRKRRNQYFWGIAVFYVYSVLDGMVDASLADFDAPQRFAVSGSLDGTIAGVWHIPF